MDVVKVCCWGGKDQHRLLKALRGEGLCITGMHQLTACCVPVSQMG